MTSDIARSIREIDSAGWPSVSLEYGAGVLQLSVPPEHVILSMKDAAVLMDPERSIEEALDRPIGGPPLETIIRRKGKAASEITAAIAVSDITRPVPYRGKGGLLEPLLGRLERASIRPEKIAIIVGTGTHRPSTSDEKIAMFGESLIRRYPIFDHRCESLDCLVRIGTTRRGTEAFLNGEFVRADIKIVTGLVESHFMAGVSGGRKGVCPGLADLQTIQKFHGPGFLESPWADNLLLDGNPCHEESLDVARAVDVDFTVNVTLDKNMRLTGVFAGALEDAHLSAFHFMKSYTAIPVDQEYDIVLTHAGYSGRNHYQTAKAGCAAVPAVKRGGAIIIAADNHDPEPIGGPEYRDLIGRLKALGTDGYLGMISDPSWSFAKDQWEPEVWSRVLRKVGEAGLFYCSPQISAEEYGFLPGRSGLDFLDGTDRRPGPEAARTMVQNALFYLLSQHRRAGRRPSVAVLREGPYGIPVLRESSIQRG
jgi:nickel-dependent lactate racemase